MQKANNRHFQYIQSSSFSVISLVVTKLKKFRQNDDYFSKHLRPVILFDSMQQKKRKLILHANGDYFLNTYALLVRCFDEIQQNEKKHKLILHDNDHQCSKNLLSVSLLF